MIFLMTKKRILLMLILLMAACSGHPAKEQSSGGPASKSEIKFEVIAVPRQGFTPLHVSFSAKLEGVNPNDAKYYCLRENWDFGDDAKSSEKPNCDPYGPDSKVKTEFFTDHTYNKEGNYTIRLSLGEEGKEVIRSRPVSIRVLERNLGPNGL